MIHHHLRTGCLRQGANLPAPGVTFERIGLWTTVHYIAQNAVKQYATTASCGTKSYTPPSSASDAMKGDTCDANGAQMTGTGSEVVVVAQTYQSHHEKITLGSPHCTHLSACNLVIFVITTRATTTS